MKATILLLEDNLEVLTLLKLLLEKEDYEVIAFSSSVSACEQLGGLRPDVIVTDLMMPKISGLDFIRWVRQIPQFADVPIVVLSAFEKTYHGVATVMGATEVLRKPEDLGLLNQTIEEVLSKKRAREIA